MPIFTNFNFNWFWRLFWFLAHPNTAAKKYCNCKLIDLTIFWPTYYFCYVYDLKYEYQYIQSFSFFYLNDFTALKIGFNQLLDFA